MSAQFEKCLSYTLTWEGGFVDNPHDPGGATCCGVTLAQYQHWSDNPHLGIDDIRAIPSSTVTAIYATSFWNATRCDFLPSGLDMMVFDESVTAGCSRAVRLLQQALHLPAASVDGSIGPQTIDAAGKGDPATLIVTLAALQLDFYRALPTFGIFGAGWTTRLERRKTAAIGMVAYADA